jgi:hypothetical protein
MSNPFIFNPSAKTFTPPPPRTLYELNYEEIQQLIRQRTIIPVREDETAIDYEIHSNSLIGKRYLTIDQFKAIPSGYGGRAGVVPYFIDEDGGRNYILNISNWNLYGDFGGGVKANTTPYEGLRRELLQEAPQWEEYFMSIMDNEAIIYNTENLAADRKDTLRTSTMILIQIDAAILQQFQKTKEVTELVVVNDEELLELFNETERQINNGLKLIRSIYPHLVYFGII